MMKDRNFLILLLFLIGLVSQPMFGQDMPTIKSEDLPETKRTSLELYVPAEYAYKMWKEDPKEIYILDVRTLEEYIFVGHADMAVNITLAVQTDKWDDEKGMFGIEPNPDFLDLVKEWAEEDDIILVMCRSGGRSAMAVNLMAKAGYTNVYNIIDGMEGDMVKDKGSVYYGKREKNGWKNSGNPWTYQINPEQVKLAGQ